MKNLLPFLLILTLLMPLKQSFSQRGDETERLKKKDVSRTDLNRTDLNRKDINRTDVNGTDLKRIDVEKPEREKDKTKPPENRRPGYTPGNNRKPGTGVNPPVNDNPPEIIIIEPPVIIYESGPDNYPPPKPHPPFPEQHDWKAEGIEKFKAEDYTGALADFNRAIYENSDDYELYFYRGSTEIKIKLFREALDDLDIFLEYEFYKPEGYFQRGLAKFYLGKKAEALEDFQIAYELGYQTAAVIIRRFF